MLEPAVSRAADSPAFDPIQAQKDLGADIIIPLDELPGHHISREKLAQSVRLLVILTLTLTLNLTWLS